MNINEHHYPDAEQDASQNDHLDQQQLSPAEKARLKTLKAMLDASKMRQQAALRRKRPVLAAGEKVSIISGQFEGEQAEILDADYIDSRVLLSLPSNDSPIWLPFNLVGQPER